MELFCQYQLNLLSGSERYNLLLIISLSIYFFFIFCLFGVTPGAYGGSQARGLIGAVATGLRQNHSNTGSEPRLRLTPQLTATPDPELTERGQGLNLQSHGS